MDSSFSFSPLWEDPAIIYKPEKALDALHAKILSIILRKIDLPKEGEKFYPKGNGIVIVSSMTAT